MTEETQLPTPEPIAPTPPVSDVIPEPPKKSNRTLWTILAIATTVVVCCLCIMLCMGTVGTGIWKAYTEQKPVQAVLDAYMKAMAAKDVDSAYNLFSPRVQKVATPAKLREMLQGNNYVVFENYESLTIVNFNISTADNTNPDAPQGTVARWTARSLIAMGSRALSMGLSKRWTEHGKSTVLSSPFRPTKFNHKMNLFETERLCLRKFSLDERVS